MDRVADFESVGRGFESLMVHKKVYFPMSGDIPFVVFILYVKRSVLCGVSYMTCFNNDKIYKNVFKNF